MCGIFVAMGENISINPELVAAVGKLDHRGPDNSGHVLVELSWTKVFLGMTRLKVVDQTDLPVPYDFRENLGVILAFNGEVFNWRALRTELGGFHGGWQTQCDAEVVAAAWRQWGPDCLSSFNGMWGLVLVDTWQNEVFVARDRAGEKPVYTLHQDDVTFFSSEIKALPGERHLRERPMDMLTLEFDFGRETPFEDVEALEPGCYQHYRDMDGGAVQRWWSLPAPDPEPYFQDDLVEELVELLRDAVGIRYNAEVPVAVQLSGGLDSAIIQAICKSKRLYCVTFPEIDNLTPARLMGDVTSIMFSKDDLLAELGDVAYHLDTPATWTAVCQWFLNREIAEDGNVIVMAGEGADELFGGYARYRVLYWLDQMYKDKRLEGYSSLINHGFNGTSVDLLGNMLNRRGSETIAHAVRLVERYSKDGWLLADRLMHTDFYTTMQVLLRMADRMAMAWSLENRAPFLDYRLMELSQKIPMRFKVDEYESKGVLRRAAYVLGVPKGIVDEKTKRGLAVPASWGDPARPLWDRGWFSELMNSVWFDRCCGVEQKC